MRIVDDLGIPVRACASFNYRGATISCSTIFDASQVEVVVWSATSSGPDKPLYECTTVERACMWIDQNIAKKVSKVFGDLESKHGGS